MPPRTRPVQWLGLSPLYWFKLSPKRAAKRLFTLSAVPTVSFGFMSLTVSLPNFSLKKFKISNGLRDVSALTVNYIRVPLHFHVHIGTAYMDLWRPILVFYVVQ